MNENLSNMTGNLPDFTEARNGIMSTIWDLLIDIIMGLLQVIFGNPIIIAGIQFDRNMISGIVFLISLIFLILNAEKLIRWLRVWGSYAIIALVFAIILQVVGVNLV